MRDAETEARIRELWQAHRWIRWVYRLWLALVSTLAAVLALELALRWEETRLQRRESLTKGMVQFDAELGWVLTANWRGAHHHGDFRAHYTIEDSGFRRSFAPRVAPAEEEARAVPGFAAAEVPAVAPAAAEALTEPAERRIFVLGDSFTFGIGVDDEDTFVWRLNARRAVDAPAGGGRWVYVNAGVPGYSTDQELLLVEQRLLRWRPAGILLVVYLANDVLDNLRVVPLQARHAKPTFTLVAGELAARKGALGGWLTEAAAGREGLPEMLFGADARQWPASVRWQQVSALARHLEHWWPADEWQPRLAERLEPGCALTLALLLRLQRRLEGAGVGWAVALLGGRSYVEEPGSWSAQFQEVLRARLAGELRARRVPLIDLATELRAREGRCGQRAYHPADGHLNAQGHAWVAEALAPAAAAMAGANALTTTGR